VLDAPQQHWTHCLAVHKFSLTAKLIFPRAAAEYLEIFEFRQRTSNMLKNEGVDPCRPAVRGKPQTVTHVCLWYAPTRSSRWDRVHSTTIKEAVSLDEKVRILWRLNLLSDSYWIRP
jgi:hypothetical protein